MTNPLATGATIGILGGGQLGRMLSVAASRLGFKTCIFEPGGDCPASHVANYHMQAGYDDLEALKKFAQSCDVITYEFENIPTEALDVVEAITPDPPEPRSARHLARPVFREEFPDTDRVANRALCRRG